MSKMNGDRSGKNFSRARDGERLARQTRAVWNVMRVMGWRTLPELASVLDEPQQSISARLRDLRKPRFGGWDVQRQYEGNGVWAYRVLKPEERAA